MSKKKPSEITSRDRVGELRNCMLMAHDAITVDLRTALYPWLARPMIIPVSFYIDFVDDGPIDTPVVEFTLCNGAIDSKLINLNRNGTVLLHYSFTVLDQGHRIARGLFKIRVQKGERI